MDAVRLVFVFGILVVLLSEGDAGSQKVLKRSKRNHVSCRPKSLVTYRLTVHALWSRDTFPKMYPTYRPHAQWSSLVGRTHGSEYQMWKEGEVSSMGVKMFTELGDPSQLNIESFQGYDDILDSFVAPPMNTSVGQTSAVIILDGHHSKLSFMIKIIPSPDWFVGVSSLDLCAHGRWKSKVHVDLGPFDAGTDQGFTFTAPNWPNTPALPISAITSSLPDHPASSFLYPEYEELPRLAFLDLDMVSEFRHRETFVSIPQHYATYNDGVDKTEGDRRPKNDEPSSTATAGESKMAKLPSAASQRHGGTDVHNEHSMNQDAYTVVNGNAHSWDKGKDERASEVKGRTGTTKDWKEDEVYGKDGATSKPVTHKEQQKNELSLNSFSETLEKETNPQHTTQYDNSFDLSTKTHINTKNAGAHVSKVTVPSPENGKPFRTNPGFFSSFGLIQGSGRDHAKPRGVGPTPHSGSGSSVDGDEYLVQEAPIQQVASVYGRSSVDCEVAEWSGWSTCSQTCGFGQQERSRGVVKYPQNGGATCPRLRQTNWCGSMRRPNCEWNHFSFLEPNVTTRQLREGPTRRRTVPKKKMAE